MPELVEWLSDETGRVNTEETVDSSSKATNSNAVARRKVLFFIQPDAYI